ncbi:MAG: DUF58 domain-containing protein [Planctomycetota bacterium]|nr:DUF58 domain-containing protein [Planctomycetota bacterium]MDA1139234.1 DUF58 domain-containing protein [Planctomycetota bacterium]
MLRRLLILILIVLVVTHLVRYLERKRRLSTTEQKSYRKTTKNGWMFFAFTFCVLLSALHTGVNLIYLTFSVLVSALILSWLINAFSGAALSIERTFPSEVQAGFPFNIDIAIRNESAFIPAFCLSLEQRFPDGILCEFQRHFIFKISAGQVIQIRLKAVARKRGVYDFSVIEVETSFPFGFFERGMICSTQKLELLALPRLGHLENRLPVGEGDGRASARRFTHNGIDEFLGLREYRAGDNPGWIHWKTSAKVQKPIVREYGARNEQKALILLHWVRARGDEQALLDEEVTTSFIATMARELARNGLQVAFACDAGGFVYLPPVSSRGINRIWRLLALLAPAEVEDATGLIEQREFSIREFDKVVLITHGSRMESSGTIVRHLNSLNRSVTHLDAASGDLERSFTLPDLAEAWIAGNLEQVSYEVSDVSAG